MDRTLMHLNKNDLQLLHGKVQLGRVQPGQFLVKEGTPPLGVFIVRTGSVLVQRTINSYTITAVTLGENDMFGEAAFIDPHHPAAASVVAADETDVIVLTPQRLQPVFDENPGLCGRFFHSIAHVVARRLRAFNEQAGGRKTDPFGDLPSWEIL